MNKSLVFVLGGIIVINIIAIIILQARMEVLEEKPAIERYNPRDVLEPIPEERQVVRSKTKVRMLVVEDTVKCPECFDIDQYTSKISPLMNLSIGRASPSEFDLDYYPVLMFNQSIEAYPELVEGWGDGQIIEITDGKYSGKWYILPTLNAPYFDVHDNQTKGLVTVTYLSYDKCEECYDVRDNRDLLEEQNLIPYREFEFDALSIEGSTLVRKYNITKFPTMVLDMEAAYYPSITLGWHIVGTQEEDGSYVLRELDRLKVIYYDSTLNRVMIP